MKQRLNKSQRVKVSKDEKPVPKHYKPITEEKRVRWRQIREGGE